jgi:uncharacterized membrane protein
VSKKHLRKRAVADSRGAKKNDRDKKQWVIFKMHVSVFQFDSTLYISFIFLDYPLRLFDLSFDLYYF